MKTTVKSTIIAAITACVGFAAIPTVQAQENFGDNFYPDDQLVQEVGNDFYDDYRPHRRFKRHHRNGFSFSYQFGNPDIFFEPRHPRRVVRVSQAHVAWCYSRYRTYDHRSNSFVLRHGQRAYCVSPYSY